jgi:hypothetical protein
MLGRGFRFDPAQIACGTLGHGRLFQRKLPVDPIRPRSDIEVVGLVETKERGGRVPTSGELIDLGAPV